MACAGRIPERALRRLRRVAARRPHARPVQRGRARELRMVRAQRSHPHPRRRTHAVDERGPRRTFPRATCQCHHARATRVDVGSVGRAGARNPVQGIDRRRAAGRSAGRIHAGHARLGAVEKAASCLGRRDLPGNDCAMVRRGVCEEPGILRLLLHSRAFHALSHWRASARGRVVVFRAHLRRRHPAVARGFLRNRRWDVDGCRER